MTAARGALLSLVSAFSLVIASSVLACQPPESPAAYVINHETYGDIGTHVLTFACEGDDLVVETEVDVKVKVLFITAYKRKAHLREVWRDDRLIAYDARTEEGSDFYETSARIKGDHMIVDGVEKGVAVPLDAVSTNPWNVKAVDRTVIFGQRDGRIRNVEVEETGWETLKIGDQPVDAQKYVISGDLERELFYDADGTWLQWRLERDGKTVTITKRGLDRLLE